MSLFSNKSVGIDIADRTIEVAELSKKGSGFKVSSLGRIELPGGIVERGEIKDEEKLMIFVNKAMSSAEPHPIVTDRVVFGLPENHVYIHTFISEDSSEKNIDNIVLEEVRMNIPIPDDDLIFSHKVLSEGKDGDEILIVATRNSIATRWQEFFEKLNIKVETFDIESLATFRGLFGDGVKEPMCLVDFGSSTTHISIFDNNGLQYSYTSNIAGDLITKEIASALGKSDEEAEELKRSVGLSKADKKVYTTVEKILKKLTSDIQQNISYFEDRTGKTIEKILFVGGSSALIGLNGYLEGEFGDRADIGKNVFSESEVPLVYIEATGLALRGIDSKWDEKSPVIEPIFKKRESKSKKGGLKKYFTFVSFGLHKISSLLPKKSNGNKEVDPKLKRQKMILLSLLIFGIVAVPASYWYRSYSEAARLDKIQSSIEAIGENIEKQIEQTQKVGEDIVIEDSIVDSKEVVDRVVRIVITETPTGWLNVRSGPSVEYSKLAKIYPGDSFIVLMEEDNWYKIKIDGETNGWVTSEYVNELN